MVSNIRIYKEADSGGWDESTYLDLPPLQFGDAEELKRGQSIRESTKGYHAVIDRGFKQLVFAGIVTDMTHAQKMAAMVFFGDTVMMARYRIYIRVENENKNASWNQSNIPWRAGYTIGGSEILAGQSVNGNTITAGALIPADYEFIGPIRLSQNGLKWTDDARYQYSLSLAGIIENAE